MVKTLFQASTWNALALGNFDTVISVRELLRCADTGVGIGTALDGFGGSSSLLVSTSIA